MKARRKKKGKGTKVVTRRLVEEFFDAVDLWETLLLQVLSLLYIFEPLRARRVSVSGADDIADARSRPETAQPA